ncbi:nitrite transporter [Klebsiella pneumoniae]|uniref:nitrite transporter n=1 Tax=Klebsiella pneumoniae complex TaxID=3390273 RepID=UPI000B95563B|nr:MULTISPECIES: nitrite transporter [Klebsiella]EMB4700066.1 nitrite transporter [Klebsiella pneumoniae]MBC4425889.1 nitrite transporter [Klebsiella variicola]MCH0755299.1 nitrite transporter [Klebsiella pneumoniae]OYJ10744.1 nitrite transporter [Klebsiella pneumoniae subsp. pneumoniae]HDK5502556.1 nitrite transporter [Klebsiella pneumoniae]
MFNPDKYLSVTWQKGGRSWPDLDCFGIVNEIRRDLGLPLWPDFAGVTKDDGGLDREARQMMLTLERCDPCEGAGVACYSGSAVTHVGIVVSIDGLLHVAECNPGSNVTFLPLARFKRRFVKVEFWQ